MKPTDRESKNRLFLLLGLPVLLFGGFALWGVAGRTLQTADADAIESPVKLTAERAAIVAKQREAFVARKTMATWGKNGEWQRAARVVTDDLLARNPYRNLRFLRGEAWFRAGDKRGAIALHDALKSDNALIPHEADLLTGNAVEYRADTANALRIAEVAPASLMDANGLAWRTTLAPRLADAAGLEKAVALSEYAVSAAPNLGDKDILATYTNTLGAIYFRAGHSEEAVRVLTDSEKRKSDPFNAAFLSLAYRDLGESEKAHEWHDRLQTYLDRTYATRDGQTNRHQLLLLWRENAGIGGQKRELSNMDNSSKPAATIGVFGGSGFYSFLSGNTEGVPASTREVKVDTPYGAPSDAVTLAQIGDKTVAFLPRHGRSHTIPPHKINYRANLWAMKSLGVTDIIGPNACGSLQAHVKPGDFVVCDQFVDRTTGRADTFYEGPLVTHVSAAEPYCPLLREHAIASCRAEGITVHDSGTVVVINGPRFSSKSESRWFGSQGWEVINMTQYPESYLARELEISYVNISLITDFDAGLEEHAPVTNDDVLAVFNANLDNLRRVLRRMIENMPDTSASPARSVLSVSRFEKGGLPLFG